MVTLLGPTAPIAAQPSYTGNPEMDKPTNELIQHRTQSCNRRSIVNLNARHREIMRRIALGERQCDIAADIGMSQVSLSIVVNSPLFKQELAKWLDKMDEQVYDAMKELREVQRDAVLAIHDSVTQKELPVLRFHAARDILNRTGVQVPKEYHVTKQQTSYEELLHSVRIKYQQEDLEKRPAPTPVEYEAEEAENE